MTRSIKVLSLRKSMPEIQDVCNSKRQSHERLQFKEDLNFLKEFGFISPRYLSKKQVKKPKADKPLATAKKEDKKNRERIKLKASFSDDFAFQEKLKNTHNNYLEFQETVKPSARNLQHLCPLELPSLPKSLCSPVPSSLPKVIHSKYIHESMDFLKSTGFRIKKAKEYISIARRMSKKY